MAEEDKNWMTTPPTPLAYAENTFNYRLRKGSRLETISITSKVIRF